MKVQLFSKRVSMISTAGCMIYVKQPRIATSTTMRSTMPTIPTSTWTRPPYRGKAPLGWRWWFAAPLWTPKQPSMTRVLLKLCHHRRDPPAPRTIPLLVLKVSTKPANPNEAHNPKACAEDGTVIGKITDARMVPTTMAVAQWSSRASCQIPPQSASPVKRITPISICWQSSLANCLVMRCDLY